MPYFFSYVRLIIFLFAGNTTINYHKNKKCLKGRKMDEDKTSGLAWENEQKVAAKLYSVSGLLVCPVSFFFFGRSR